MPQSSSRINQSIASTIRCGASLTPRRAPLHQSLCLSVSLSLSVSVQRQSRVSWSYGGRHARHGEGGGVIVHIERITNLDPSALTADSSSFWVPASEGSTSYYALTSSCLKPTTTILLLKKIKNKKKERERKEETRIKNNWNHLCGSCRLPRSSGLVEGCGRSK